MVYPEFRWRFTPGFIRIAPPVLSLEEAEAKASLRATAPCS
jgi:hypothetical protein